VPIAAPATPEMAFGRGTFGQDNGENGEAEALQQSIVSARTQRRDDQSRRKNIFIATAAASVFIVGYGFFITIV